MEYVGESVAHARVTRTILATYCPATSVLPFLPTHPPTCTSRTPPRGRPPIPTRRPTGRCRTARPPGTTAACTWRKVSPTKTSRPSSPPRNTRSWAPTTVFREARQPTGAREGGSCCCVCIKCKDLFIRMSSGQSGAVWLRVRRLESSHTPAATYTRPRAPRAARADAESEGRRRGARGRPASQRGKYEK